MVEAVRAAGAALRDLHRTELPADVDGHGPRDEVEVLHKWLERLTMVRPDLYRAVRTQIEPIITELMATETTAVLLHRDFYDKQVFIADDGQIGLLDFDTLAAGEAALDVANALDHISLRTLQGHYSWTQAIAAQSAFLTGYGIDHIIQKRLAPYVHAARLRLVCVYACRPAGNSVCEALLDWETDTNAYAYWQRILSS